MNPECICCVFLYDVLIRASTSGAAAGQPPGFPAVSAHLKGYGSEVPPPPEILTAQVITFKVSVFFKPAGLDWRTQCWAFRRNSEISVCVRHGAETDSRIGDTLAEKCRNAASPWPPVQLTAKNVNRFTSSVLSSFIQFDSSLLSRCYWRLLQSAGGENICAAFHTFSGPRCLCVALCACVFV